MKKLMSDLIFFLFFHVNVQEILVAQDTDISGLTPMQVAELKQVNEIVLAADGKQIAYTLEVQADPAEENKAASNELYLLDTRRRAWQQKINGPV